MEIESDLAIEDKIFVIRSQRVMLDSDLAALFKVKTGDLNRSVRRHPDRFPYDFMFQLTAEEFSSLRCQIGILKNSRGTHRKYSPLAFTEQGVAMLAGILNSDRAIRMSISIIRTFVRLRRMIAEDPQSNRLAKIEKGADQLFRGIFHRLDTLERNTPLLPPNRRKIGFPRK